MISQCDGFLTGHLLFWFTLRWGFKRCRFFRMKILQFIQDWMWGCYFEFHRQVSFRLQHCEKNLLYRYSKECHLCLLEDIDSKDQFYNDFLKYGLLQSSLLKSIRYFEAACIIPVFHQRLLLLWGFEGFIFSNPEFFGRPIFCSKFLVVGLYLLIWSVFEFCLGPEVSITW